MAKRTVAMLLMVVLLIGTLPIITFANLYDSPDSITIVATREVTNPDTELSIAEEADEFHHVTRADELAKKLAVVLESCSFVEFADTFSGLRGSVEEVSYALSQRFDDVNTDTIVPLIPLIQLDALYSLYSRGVDNADAWVYYTTIDLTPYGDLWVKMDFNTGGEYYYAIVDEQLVQIEVSFTPNDMETSALRQALLAPHTVANIMECSHVDIMSFAPLSTQAVRIPDSSLRNAPYRSIGVVHGRFPNMPSGRDIGSAFIISRRLALTSGHVAHFPQHGGRLSNITLMFGRSAAGGPLTGSGSAIVAWVDSRWVLNQEFQFDQAILQFNDNLFPNAGMISLSHSVAVGNSVRVVGYTNRNGANPRWFMYRANGSVTRFVGNRFNFSPFTYYGMSGGPILNTANSAVGIMQSGYNFPGGSSYAVRISQPLINQINILNSSF